MFILNRRSAAGLLALTLLAGCKDALGPGSADVASLSSDVTAMTAAFMNSASLQDMSRLSPLFPLYSPAAGVRAAFPVSMSRQALLARAAAERSLARLLSSSPQALFPPAVLGRTLAFDAASYTYKIDSTLTGAPANGIRILIYATNALTGQPVLPLSQTGYLELTDKSSPQSPTLGVLLTFGAVTVVQYDVTVVTTIVAGDTSGFMVYDGFANDPAGAGRVDFVFADTVLHNATMLVLTGQLTAADGARIRSSLTITAGSPSGFALAVSVSKGANAIALDAVETNALTGQVKFNGVTVATLSGDLNAPTFTSANGHRLTSAESSGLLEIVDGALLAVGDLQLFVLWPTLVVFHG